MEFDIYTILWNGDYLASLATQQVPDGNCDVRASCGNVAKEPNVPPCETFIVLVNGIVNTRDFYEAVFLANTCSGQILSVEEKILLFM